MCLSCEYSSYSQCIECKSLICRKVAYNSIKPLCDICWEIYPKKSRCRTCMIIFESRNKLFRHLNIESHDKDYITMRDLHKIVSSNREEYKIRGFFI